MKLTISRFIAVLMLVIPGFIATYGFLLIKDSLFAAFDPLAESFPWGKLVLGVVLFFAGVAYLGGWIFFRDRKRNYVAPRFKAKRPRPPRPKQP
ncbi:MAG: hypothetical protein K0R75_123 [Paenibacillaceae bacterium]|jgi:hypothetical protein|nr:hypothetical protein [Paenibacillaceae bacterium]